MYGYLLAPYSFLNLVFRIPFGKVREFAANLGHSRDQRQSNGIGTSKRNEFFGSTRSKEFHTWDLMKNHTKAKLFLGFWDHWNKSTSRSFIACLFKFSFRVGKRLYYDWRINNTLNWKWSIGLDHTESISRLSLEFDKQPNFINIPSQVAFQL